MKYGFSHLVLWEMILYGWANVNREGTVQPSLSWYLDLPSIEVTTEYDCSVY